MMLLKLIYFLTFLIFFLNKMNYLKNLKEKNLFHCIIFSCALSDMCVSVFMLFQKFQCATRELIEKINNHFTSSIELV